jgi:hypothetical protein
MPTKPIEIKQTRLILAEGADAYYFMIWAYQAYGRTDIQVIDFGGIDDLRRFLGTLRLTDNFESVETILIARDAETDWQASIDSVRYRLQQAGLAAPETPFSFTNTLPKIGFVLFPGFEDREETRIYLNGALEDLCLSTVANDPLMPCVDSYLDCVSTIGEIPRHRHKSRLHAYLSCKAGHAGKRLSEAAKHGAFDWEHPRLLPCKQAIIEM